MEGGRWWTLVADFFAGSITGSVVSVLNDVNAVDIGYLLGFIHKAPEVCEQAGSVAATAAKLNFHITISRKSISFFISWRPAAP
jgi:hypothetical protein